MYKTISYVIDADGILTITLNRPEQMNSFTVEMSGELREAFIQADGDDSVKVVVVTGAGKAFCAGMDLSADGNVFGLNEAIQPTLDDMNDRLDAPEIHDGIRDEGGKLTLEIYKCRKPIIAAINGAAVGIGATMTCAMDIRLASEKARIGFVFNKIGIVPEACSSWFLPRIVGLPKSLELCFTGDIIDGAEAKDIGFVTNVLPAEELLNEAYALARRIAKHSPVALALTRQMLYRNSAKGHPLEAHKIDSLGMFYQSIADGKEGVSAFLEKRPAEYKQKCSTDMPSFYPWEY
ncbi:enoyl-CoA hydratase [Oleiphilus sp. HI0009]|uniref:crotonase/enoyl-CoA hydratase family protein n=1 Tax=unclassified Oleiphilus TaxID=2631174 RepID=UPI0007C27A5F|nr:MULTISPECIES: crotonase/enoyl-CoA hydratase family protein [unclassified Oleiphilus]KZX76391.1 enoyl-CoA hydratase [Oleiphilus sp. HI0009]KZY69945.1 enoyl-CoA hydratase [Oleiphilus sp. HI0066]KZY71960.1 enoyl-CoA hydratase [Oleiphilus sp. HI0067]MCH2157918.1 crotonase/enoyl-CoA hydratase family protein [Oleiphilaceae bacterium]